MQKKFLKPSQRVSKQIKIINDSIDIPKKLQQNWKGAKAFIEFSNDTIFIKRLTPPSLSEMLNEFKEVGKEFTKKDVEDAIKWARRQNRNLKKK